MMNKRRLVQEIALVLYTGLKDYEQIISNDENVVVVLSSDDFQNRLGVYYQRTVQIIEEYFPQRDEDIRLFFRDLRGRQSVFRIWNSVAA